MSIPDVGLTSTMKCGTIGSGREKGQSDPSFSGFVQFWQQKWPPEDVGMLAFRAFLRGLEEVLEQSVVEAENCQWHHLPVESPQFQHYLRLMTWLEEVIDRGKHFDNIKAGKQTRRSWRELQAWSAERDRLGRHDIQLHAGERSPGHQDALGGVECEGGYGDYDLDKDDNSC